MKLSFNFQQALDAIKTLESLQKESEVILKSLQTANSPFAQSFQKMNSTLTTALQALEIFSKFTSGEAHPSALFPELEQTPQSTPEPIHYPSSVKGQEDEDDDDREVTDLDS